MPELSTPYVHLRGALSAEDIGFLTGRCKRQLSQEKIPCYALLDDLESPTFLKIKALVEAHIAEDAYYLNDFYIYTDSSFKTHWHMDTELFSFARAVNAWILLSPESIENPLGFINDLNDSMDRYFHSVKIEDGQCVFSEFVKGRKMTRSLDEVDANQIRTPEIRVGDILLINPRRFHKTNVESAKHAFSMKFVSRGENGFLSDAQVPALLWPEVATFNQIVRNAERWEDVIEGIRQALATEKGRKRLSAGFYPEKFDLYREKIEAL